MNTYKKIIQYVKPYWNRVMLNVLFNFLSVVFSLFSLTMVVPFLRILFSGGEPMDIPLLTGASAEALLSRFNYFINQLVIDFGPINALIFIGVFVIITSLLKNGFKYLSLYHLAALRNGVVKDIRNDIYGKSVALPLSYYSKEKKGDIISRMSSDVSQIEISVISSLEMVFREPLTILVYLAYLVAVSPSLTLFVLLLLPLSGLIIGRTARSLKNTALKSQGKLGLIISVMEETLGGLRVIKAFNAEDRMNRRFQSLNAFYTRIMNKMYRRQYLASPLSELLGTMVVVIIMIFGGMLVLGGGASMSSEGFIGYLVVFSQIINPSKSFSQAYYNIQKGMASAQRIDELLSAENVIIEAENPVSKKTFDSEIVFQNVGFGYDAQEVVKEIDLRIEKGSKVALVGQSGAGKSTLVDLLARFYDVDQGVITLDGIPIQQIRLSDLRSLMGNVNQDPILFNDNFFNNIAFGKEDASREEVENAARIANAHEFIENSPLGYYTNIGDRGSRLSGGQRQRISIARAVLSNPPILILDEATSSLDTESEHLVEQALSNIMKNRTSIVVAHRLSTIINADIICVLHQGRIVETGTHKELINKQGYYRKLHDMQIFAG